MAATEEKKYLVNIESNIEQYAKEVTKAGDDVKKFKTELEELKKSGKASDEELAIATARLKTAQKEYNTTQGILRKLVAANVDNKNSYDALYKTWQAAEAVLKRQEGTLKKAADGTYELTEEYKKAKTEALNAKKALDEFGKGTKDNRLNVGNYSEAIEQATKKTSVFSRINISIPMITAGAAIVGVFNQLKSAIQYSKEFEKALSSLRSLTGASSDDLKFYKQTAKELGDQFGATGVEMIDAFKIVGSAKSELLSSKEALTDVTKAALVLAKASGLDVPAAADSLTVAMNQFSAPASEANRYINALAAGAKEGAAEVPDLSDSLKKFGAVASSANLSIEQSVSLIEALAEKGIKGEVAGTGIKSFLLKLESGAKDTRPSVVGLDKALENLKKQSLSNAEVTKRFGLETANVALTLINQADRVKELQGAVSGTSEAYKQAEINQDNLAGATSRLSAKWTNFKETLLNSRGVFSSFLKGLMDDLANVIDGFEDLIKSTQQLKLEAIDRETKRAIDSYKELIRVGHDRLTLEADIAEFSAYKSQWETRLAKAKKASDEDEIAKSEKKILLYEELLKIARTQQDMDKQKKEDDKKSDEQKEKKTAEEALKAWKKYYDDRKALLEAEKILAEDNYEKLKKNIQDITELELSNAQLTKNQKYLLKVQEYKALKDLQAKFYLESIEKDKAYNDFLETLNNDAIASDAALYSELNKQRKEDSAARIETKRLEADGDLYILLDILDDEYNTLQMSEEYKQASDDKKALMDAQYAANRIGITRQLYDYEKSLEDKALENKRKTFAATADLLGSMSQLVGDNTLAGKSFAIAQATINTYLAASQALASAPNPIIGAIQMAAAIAMGLAQVKQIMAVKVNKNASGGAGGGAGGGSGSVVSSSFTAANQSLATSNAQTANSDRLGQIQQNANNQASARTAAQTTAQAISERPIKVELSVEAFEAKAAEKRQVEVRSNI